MPDFLPHISPVKEIRLRYGLTQKQFAAEIGYSVGWINAIENEYGKVSIEFVEAVEDFVRRQTTRAKQDEAHGTG